MRLQGSRNPLRWSCALVAAVALLGLVACGGGKKAAGTSGTGVSLKEPSVGLWQRAAPGRQGSGRGGRAASGRAEGGVPGLPLHGPQEHVERLEAQGPRPLPRGRGLGTVHGRLPGRDGQRARGAPQEQPPGGLGGFPAHGQRRQHPHRPRELQRVHRQGRGSHHRRAPARTDLRTGREEGRRRRHPGGHGPDLDRHAGGRQRLAEPHAGLCREHRAAAADHRRQGERPVGPRHPGSAARCRGRRRLEESARASALA